MKNYQSEFYCVEFENTMDKLLDGNANKSTLPEEWCDSINKIVTVRKKNKIKIHCGVMTKLCINYDIHKFETNAKNSAQQAAWNVITDLHILLYRYLAR